MQIYFIRLLKLASYTIPPTLALFLLLSIWEIWVRAADVPVYIFPAPSIIFTRLFQDVGFFLSHGMTTLTEALLGFIIGTAIAMAGATFMAHSRLLERSLLPIAVMIKVTPIVAIAPIFVIWFGFGSFPKILIASLITFFPVLVNGMSGLRNVDPVVMDLLNSLNASKREIYFKLRLPSSLPYLFAAFKISIPLSVIGAVVGEWFSGDRGLGSVIIVSHGNLDMPTLFSAIFVLAGIGVALTIIVFYLEKKALRWHDSSVIT